MRHDKRMLVLIVTASLGGWSVLLGSPVEQCYIPNPGWCPGLAGPTIQNEHGQWHMIGFAPFPGLEFVEFHREFLAQSDDYRLFDICTPAGAPEDAIVPVVAAPGSTLKFTHTSLNAFVRPAACDITVGCGAGVPTAWVTRPPNLRLRNLTFHGYTDNGVGSALDSMFHGNGHVSIGVHDTGGDMLSTVNATRDGAFFNWHKNIDNIYADWSVGQYQLVGNTGTPIYFSMGSAATGVPGSSLNRRRQANVYQGNAVAGADQYGAIPRIASDIYVGDLNSSNLLYHYGIRQWNTLNALDVDAFTILNPPGTEWYFSVTMASAGAAGSAVAAQAVKGGDVYESTPGTNILYRGEALLGLVAAASDNLDALEVDQQKRVQATNDSNRPGIAYRPRQWFSLRSGSTFGVEAGLAAVGPCDILRFNETGTLVIDVAAATLGLGAAGNELDALVITDEDASNTLSAGDRIYHSLAAGSPALGVNSPADILCRVYPAGGACPAGLVTRTAASIGLLATDDLDALDVRITPSPNGACCRALGICQDGVPQAACPNPDIFWGPGTVCSAAECPSQPGACCHRDGTCTQVGDTACALAGGTFRGPGTICPVCAGGVNNGLACSSNADCPGGTCPLACPQTPPNDTCNGAYEIPYDYPTYYEPPYRDNTYATSSYDYEYSPGSPYYEPYGDPEYGCADHEVFFPHYGSGTIWYYYDVPPSTPGQGPTRSIVVSTYLESDDYAPGDAGDTRVAMYYAPNYPQLPGEYCSGLQEVACGDNYYTSGGSGTYPPYAQYSPYGSVRYDNPPPGRYYVQVSSVGNANRGRLRLAVIDPDIPTVSEWGLVVMGILVATAATLVVIRRRTLIA